MFGRSSATSWRHAPRAKGNVFRRHSRKKKKKEVAGLDRHSDDAVVVVDMDGAKAHWMGDVSLCLTRNRAFLGILPACPWTPHDFGRAIEIAKESRALRCRQGISDRQLGMMVGNAVSLHDLERLLARMLRACGFRRCLQDRRKQRHLGQARWRIQTTRTCT